LAKSFQLVRLLEQLPEGPHHLGAHSPQLPIRPGAPGKLFNIHAR
jgi:hypothetical protein